MFSIDELLNRIAGPDKSKTSPTEGNIGKRTGRIQAGDMLGVLSQGLGQLGSGQQVDVSQALGSQRQRKMIREQQAKEAAKEEEQTKQRMTLADSFEADGNSELAAMARAGGPAYTASLNGAIAEMSADKQFQNSVTLANTAYQRQVSDRRAAAQAAAGAAARTAAAQGAFFTEKGRPDLAALAAGGSGDEATELYRDSVKPIAGASTAADKAAAAKAQHDFFMQKGLPDLAALAAGGAGDQAAKLYENSLEPAAAGASTAAEREATAARATGMAAQLRAVAGTVSPAKGEAMRRAAAQMEANPEAATGIFDLYKPIVQAGIAALDKSANSERHAAVLELAGYGNMAALARAPDGTPGKAEATAQAVALMAEEPQRPFSLAPTPEIGMERLRAARPDMNDEELGALSRNSTAADAAIMTGRARTENEAIARTEVAEYDAAYNALPMGVRAGSAPFAIALRVAKSSPTEGNMQALREAAAKVEGLDADYTAVDPAMLFEAGQSEHATALDIAALGGSPADQRAAIERITALEAQSGTSDIARASASMTAAEIATANTTAHAAQVQAIGDTLTADQLQAPGVAAALAGARANPTKESTAALLTALGGIKMKDVQLSQTELDLLAEGMDNKTMQAVLRAGGPAAQTMAGEWMAEISEAAARGSQTRETDETRRVADRKLREDAATGLTGTVFNADEAAVAFFSPDAAFAMAEKRAEVEREAARNSRAMPIRDAIVADLEGNPEAQTIIAAATDMDGLKEAIGVVEEKYGETTEVKTARAAMEDPELANAITTQALAEAGNRHPVDTAIYDKVGNSIVAGGKIQDARRQLVTAMRQMAETLATHPAGSGPVTALLNRIGNIAEDIVPGLGEAFRGQDITTQQALINANAGQLFGLMRMEGAGATSDIEGVQYRLPLPSATNLPIENAALAQRLVRMATIDDTMLAAQSSYAYQNRDDPEALGDSVAMNRFIDDAVTAAGIEQFPMYDTVTKTPAELLARMDRDEASGNVTASTLIVMVGAGGQTEYVRYGEYKEWVDKTAQKIADDRANAAPQ
jgi:hypothetical protein